MPSLSVRYLSVNALVGVLPEESKSPSMAHALVTALANNAIAVLSSKARIRGHKHILAKVCFWSILLKKSAVVSTAEKYAFEIEILTFG